MIIKFEESLNCENLKINKSLVNLMDDNLSIHLNAYLTNSNIAKYNFTKEKIIEAIQLSDKYTYDAENDLIKLKYKPKRKIIVFRDIKKEDQKIEKIIDLFQ